MATYFFAVLVSAATAAAPGVAPTPPVAIPADWASETPNRKVIEKAIKETLAEDREKTNETAPRPEGETLRGDKYENFAANFESAAVPGCLRPDGLKHQPARIGPFAFNYVLALPFLAAAAIRGKCR